MRKLILWIALIPTLCYASYDYYRLPRSIKPQHYKLRILTHLEDATRQFFTGDVKIQLQILQPTSNITLHVGARLNIATNATWLQAVTNKNCKSISIKSVERNMKYDFFIMHLDTELLPAHRYVLRLQFWARLERIMSGYYASSYQDESNSSEINFMSVTQFEPTDARSAFPCFDEPDLKATFSISLGHSTQYNALSNMPVVEKIPICERENWVWSIFRRTEIMSTYLVAYSINDFEGYASYNTPCGRSLRFTTWARSSAIEQCKYAAQIGPEIMAFYEQLFDIQYPLPKMDQLAVPDFSAGAMENWGLITYREASLLYAEETSSLTDKQHVTNIIAHELAHQWFGNLVTMEWWNDLWLNEGFATYVATLGMDRMCNKWHAYEEESVDNVLAILSTDAFISTRPIHQPVSRGSQIAELFDAITYRKGAVIIRMMHIFIGDKAFHNGLKSYLQSHSYVNAKQEDLWLALTKASHEILSIPTDLDVKTVMDTWTLQPGIPLISVQRNYLKNTATITQKRYLVHDEHMPGKINSQELDETYCWFIPISYTIESQSNFMCSESRIWFRCTEPQSTLQLELKDLPDDDEWVILNLQLSTPYRINYDICNWQLIIKGLQSSAFKRIHVMNRAQLIDDSLALAWSGHLSYTLALQLLDYLQHEHDYIPWRAALDKLAAIECIMRKTSKFEEFQHYMHHLLEPIYNHLEGMFEDVDNRHHVAHKTLINRWACHLCLADCVKRALKYYHCWSIQKNPEENNPVPRNLRSVIYCTAVQHGDAEDWNFLWQRYRNSTVASERHLILLSLSCSQDVNQIERYLELIFKRKSLIRKQEASQIFAAIMRNDAVSHIAKEFLLFKFKLLQKFYDFNRRELVSLIIQVAHQVNTARDYRQLKEFIDGHRKQLNYSGLGLRRALEQAQINLQWRQRRQAEFIKNLEMRFFD